jgi:hypothetical protein
MDQSLSRLVWCLDKFTLNVYQKVSFCQRFSGFWPGEETHGTRGGSGGRERMAPAFGA